MSYCIKTGARVYIQELDVVVAADIYAVGPANAVIRWTPGSETKIPASISQTGDGTVFYLPARPEDYTHIAHMANFDKGDWLRADLCVLVTMRNFLYGELCD